ncbi:isocitrate lyase/phosphoenolpyruvate mutase family protein [Brevundimonas sp.]|uniref:isocitrate lyase/PEP mutase family protein n=1 Tax=Brevundimonas sp. TaxID=1871086 RepID=UPI0025BC90AD|nr:isocitrate lyase/phosphoenolpyruvate mutase family protein [Brevundimonas sp.]
MSQSDRAAAFRRLHEDGLLILPNAWDAGTARLMASLGAKAVATTSAGVAWAHGWPDGDVLPAARLVETARAVAGAVGVPVSIDIEGGYGDDPAAVAGTARAVWDAGAVGINIEDGGGAAEALAEKIAAIRAACGPGLFINARCDVWLRGLGGLDEGLARAALYRAAGADGFFAPGLAEAETIRALAAGIHMPLNLMAVPGLPEAAALTALGVRRLSAGAAISAAAMGLVRDRARDFLATGDAAPLGQGAMGWAELNGIMART